MKVSKEISTMTQKEKVVYLSILDGCLEDYCSDVQTLAEETGMAIKTVKGVVGSLVKKGIVDAEEDERDGRTFHDLFAWTPDGKEHVCFGNENLEDDVLADTKAWIKENK